MAVLRITLGFVFLWAFFDKLLGLGFATGRDAKTGAIDFFGSGAWIHGGSPTEGFLTFGVHTKEPFATLYSNLAGHAWVDWSFMVGLLAIGAALMLGLAMRMAVVSGIAMMALMYTASAVWPANNPLIDEHVVYAVALAVLGFAGADRTWGLGNRWHALSIVQNRRWLR
ncbi:MAG: DoxX family protein [Thermoleophilia bacterium]|nr:DoxX family protein [Thermoleophilia bacterium]